MRWALLLLSFSVVAFACNPQEPVQLGSACSTNGKDACAVGKLAMCRGGKWQETLTCTGPTACQRKNIGHGMSAPICDEGLASEGNVCSEVMQIACSLDRRSQMICSGGRWRVQKGCPNGCSYPKNQVTCQ